MIIADTNLLVDLLVHGDRTADARRVFRRDPDWRAPLLWRSEFRNVLRFLIRRGLFSLADALEIMDRAESLMEGADYTVLSAPVLELAASSGISAYDCEFVSLARQIGVPLVTSDAPVLRAFPDVAVSPAAFARGGSAHSTMR
ncbi:MAG: type II toxin-antitoxin system VapC family toxin [Gemmatimonadetes bacterium]|nr:type II toxin-antitoxin system VapC family toxin [Gemmatimonadota bacterium]